MRVSLPPAPSKIERQAQFEKSGDDYQCLGGAGKNMITLSQQMCKRELIASINIICNMFDQRSQCV
uniref:Uncharacterized protein n=1 Tax=Timema genevievae TaxID=629358 RepID=A0A7R9KB96_TIMGE|nr:unnamed protein product [Timema genevievae]